MKLLDKWMADYEEHIYNRLKLTQEVRRKWVDAIKTQRTLQVNHWNPDEINNVEIPEMKNCRGWQISPKWRREVLEFETYENKHFEVTFIVESIEIDGQLYDNIIYDKCSEFDARYYEAYKTAIAKYNGFAKLMGENGCINSDLDWLINGRTDKDIREKAHKDMLAQKKAIEAKVEKICGKEITHIDEFAADIYVKGSNGRVAHLWAITAGGYNIQILHVRVLVKEVKQ